MSCDPSDNLTFWMHGEWSPGGTIWNTWISSCSGEFPNNPPGAPKIEGPNSGNAGTAYNYTFTSIDSDEDDVYYYILWGDGYIEKWEGPYPSGTGFEISHTYDNKGTYLIEAKARDSEGYESNWTTMNVTMPRNKPREINNIYLNLLLERFPNILIILKEILRFS